MAADSDQQYAYRVTFEYQGTQVRRIGQQRIAMTAPPSHEIEGHEGEVGFWYELRDTNDKTVYRRLMQSPIQTSVEVFAPDGTIKRQPVLDPKGVFQVVVPEIDGAANLVLMGTQQPPPTPIGSVAAERARPAVSRVGTAPAREIARFSLKGGGQ
jgi:hypothetical protein